MENKYYTPAIEDLFVGYECEFWADPSKEDEGWIPFKFGEVLLSAPTAYPIRINGSIRTPSLTKEQIEAEGWEQVHGYHYKNGTRVYIFGTRLTFQVHDQILFQGNIPSINEFRKISKLLNIN